MLPPPYYASPYEALDPNQPNLGSVGVRYAWDTMRQFWGQQITQSWYEIDAAQTQEILI